MLPVIIVGENVQRMQHIGQSTPMSQCVPLRNIAFDKQQDSTHIPALAAPSIVLLDIESATPQEVGSYIHRFKMTYPDSAVLVLTSFGDSVAEQAAIDHGADDVLIRPVSITRLSLTLRNLSEMVSRRTSMSTGQDYVAMGSTRPDQVTIMAEDGTLKRLHHIEQEVIQYAVDHCHGHISNTAKALGIGRSTLYRKLDAIQTRMRFQQRMTGKHNHMVGLVN